MSELTAMMIFAAAIITAIGFGVQALGKWFELQTARINKELAKSKNEAANKQTESHSQTRNGNATSSGRWLIKYLWKNQKSSIIFWFVLFSGPLIYGNLSFVDNPPPAVFIWTAVYCAPFSYLVAYIILHEAGRAYVAERLAEDERVEQSTK